jgi:predicted nuclease of restriction endonuclease-like (RecB) superfamily
MDFEQLVSQLELVHGELQQYAVRQVDNCLTIRNMLMGFYIVEFEQNGIDRAKYGANTIKELANRLKHIKGVSSPQLYRYRDFYLSYPQIFSTVLRKLKMTDFSTNLILSTALIKLENVAVAQSGSDYSYEPEILLSKLSFSHFLELMNAETPLKRAFYEVQTIKNNWGVRDLNRAMSTLLFERTSLSTDKETVLTKAKGDVQPAIADIIKNPYFLEFLGLDEKPSYTEQELETAIIDHLQIFLSELGRGFCFEARQKRITFDNKHYRIDLVFYHRILKCHVIIDLKIGQFDHADAGQMNLYLNYYRKNEMTEGDNPPIGIILCADKNDSLVEYTTTGLSNDMFVSKYLVQLPSKETLEAFIKNELKYQA